MCAVPVAQETVFRWGKNDCFHSAFLHVMLVQRFVERFTAQKRIRNGDDSCRTPFQPKMTAVKIRIHKFGPVV